LNYHLRLCSLLLLQLFVLVRINSFWTFVRIIARHILSHHLLEGRITAVAASKLEELLWLRAFFFQFFFSELVDIRL